MGILYLFYLSLPTFYSIPFAPLEISQGLLEGSGKFVLLCSFDGRHYGFPTDLSGPYLNP